MEVQGLEFLPILMAVWTFFGFIILYVLTILNGHAESYFLYISETGDYFPESVLFMVVFAVSAVLDAILSYCMYRYYAMKSSESQHCYPHLQYTILGLGWIACVGTVIVAIFPAVTHPVPHRIAAAISFLGSAIHNTCQAIFLYKLSFNSRLMCHLRMSISIITVLCLITFFLSCLIWWQICSGSLCLDITGKIAIITEWIGAIGILVYKLTHCVDFQHLTFKWHCSCKENWLFLRKTQQEIRNNSDWQVARKNRFLKSLPLPPLFYTKTGPHCNEEQENNVKLAHKNLLEGCSS
ncbi:DNA damage-regulated autophagy modulator protein 1-like [Aquarana catesbeiana]|uniref:DNA damage-regulated autophagy modulator protein 1-like n=1 Tax=Aquarana catesbeiana TaxID=8400 RepID=UPI003CC9B986